MNPESGLRARKKQRTRATISDTAISMFLANGFDQVSTADVAAAAEVSKPTLFRYFPTKEDLVLDRFADHQGELARVVRGRDPGISPLAALHRHLQSALDRRDPVSGLCDHPEVLAFYRLVFDTPGLAARLAQFSAEDAGALADALRDATAEPPESIRPRLLAIQIIAVRQALAAKIWASLAAGASADDVAPRATADTTEAFDLLSRGAADHGY